MHLLNSRNRRVDVDIGNLANHFFISGGSSKATIDDTQTESCKKKKLVIVQNDLDDVLVVRIVWGDLNKQEENEWFECGKRFLDLPDGELVVCDGNEYIDSQNTTEYIDSQEGESFERFQIKPDKYLVTVYTHMPSINVLSPKMGKSWPGVIRYFNSTRSRNKYPGWLVEAATLANEDADEIIEADRFDERYNDVEPVNFVIQLRPAKKGDRASPLTDGCVLKMQRRTPEKCPLGIIPKLAQFKTATSSKPAVKQVAVKKPKRPRVSNKAEVVQTYKVFAELLHTKDYKSAAGYFVSSLQIDIVAHLENWGERRRGLKPVSSVWLDEEPPHAAIPRWQGNQDNPKQFCEVCLLTDTNYLGLIRCQFGHGNSKHYAIADCALIQTDDGPQLAGINFLFV